MAELKKVIQIENPLLVAISEVKLKNSRERTMIPNYTLHSINLDKDIARGMAVYSHVSIDKSMIEMISDIQFEEMCLLELNANSVDAIHFYSEAYIEAQQNQRPQMQTIKT